MNNRILNGILAGAIGVAVLSGCSPEARDEYSSAGDSASNAAAKTGRAMKIDADKASAAAKPALDKAGQEIKEAAANTSRAAANDQTSIDVKSALVAAKDLTTKDLAVDTNDNKVVLHGSVPTADQKKRAEAIAKGVLGSKYTLDDQITVDSGK